MEDCEDCKRRVKHKDGFEQKDGNLGYRKIRNQTKYPVKSKEDGHERSYISPDHLDLLILSIDIPYPYIIEGPEG